MEPFMSLEHWEADSLSFSPLEDVIPRFFVSRLEDKPQNPIMDTLNCVQGVPAKNFIGKPHAIPAKAPEDSVSKRKELIEEQQDLWQTAAESKDITTACLLSWDTLRQSSFPARAVSVAFLSQCSSQTFAAARSHVRPSLQDSSVYVIHATAPDFYNALRMTLTGTSSAFHVWDPSSERFVLRGAKAGKTAVIVLTGRDEVISESLLKRFVTIGTLYRRLETLIGTLRKRLNKMEGTLHAFTHAISSILEFTSSWITSSAADSPWTNPHAMVASWRHYADIETLMRELSSLCGREEHISPSNYGPLPDSSPQLLSIIYLRLETHLETRSPRTSVALFAFILTVTSQNYFERLCQSVGYGNSDVATDPILPLAGLPISDLLDENAGLPQEETFFVEEEDDDFPRFLASDLAQALREAHKSLRLLRAAQPDHPLLNNPKLKPKIGWFWTNEEVEAAWNENVLNIAKEPTVPAHPGAATDDQLLYHNDIKEFKTFDLEPGMHLEPRRSTSTIGMPLTVSLFEEFLQTFPSELPSLTPSLPILTGLVLSPLEEHTNRLSKALVEVFLRPNTYFNLRSHLTLLRSYLLLTSHVFKMQLSAALFSDHEEPAGPKSSSQWAVGLAPELVASDSWPPGGADLSFRLRTVIIDSLVAENPRSGYEEDGRNKAEGSPRIIEEAEWRLGFAIRDLPIGVGEAKWLNPCTIEALDFLYMDYQPPHPLNNLITPTILSKYHRLFAFNLRLMRVENAIRSLFRMGCMASTPVFPTLTRSNALFLHFRFVAHSFTTSLSSYVYDTAIGGNFDAFLSKLSPSRSTVDSFPPLSTVFTLADYHSRVLDDILGACLLRSGQKAVGDLLRGILDHLLEFCILMGDLKRGRLEEYRAAPRLEEHFKVFRTKMTTLVMVLKGLVEKGAASNLHSDNLQWQAGQDPLSRSSSVSGNLSNLLVRLDVADWWKQGAERRPR